jgi:uncharacterized protein (DUF2267 family)
MEDYEKLIQRVMHWAGIEQHETAERALRGTVVALSSGLMPEDRERWAASLPNQLHPLWHATSVHVRHTAQSMYDFVPSIEGVPQPYATEHAQSVVRLLASQLSEQDRALIARHLPDEIGELVRDPRLAESELELHDQQARMPVGATLATGAGGSTHPISSAQPSRTQSGSVAAEDSTRMDRSLGAGHEEARTDTLATGRPGSPRGLAD